MKRRVKWLPIVRLMVPRTGFWRALWEPDDMAFRRWTKCIGCDYQMLREPMWRFFIGAVPGAHGGCEGYPRYICRECAPTIREARRIAAQLWPADAAPTATYDWVPCPSEEEE